MLCDKCGKNIATTHIKTVVNGVAKEQNLCGHCAKQMGYNTFAGNGFSALLASMLGDNLSLSGTKNKDRCPCCGLSFSDIAKKGKAGCSKCYETFYNELIPSIKRIHGTSLHTGKTLEKSDDNKDNDINALREKLRQLISEENYEQAAVLRDIIKAKESEIK